MYTHTRTHTHTHTHNIHTRTHTRTRTHVHTHTHIPHTCTLTYHTHTTLTWVWAALVGMLHVGVFLLLLLSGERNFGVRLNKPYTQKVPVQDISKFTGTHADLLFLVRMCMRTHDAYDIMVGA